MRAEIRFVGGQPEPSHIQTLEAYLKVTRAALGDHAQVPVRSVVEKCVFRHVRCGSDFLMWSRSPIVARRWLIGSPTEEWTQA